MSEPHPAPGQPQKLAIWQQNLDKGLDNQHELLQAMGKDRYHFAALQEPYMDHKWRTRANVWWTVVYPTGHDESEERSRAVTLVNRSLPTNTWSQVHIPCQDVVSVEFRADFGTLRVINIYNDGDHDESLEAVWNYLRSPAA
ncbi:hypothetical protein FB451DRAFT_1023954 [Mycena latifolia]|nr:hypothetical protein FB451DRAFT_1023954 [Mycena latifolia]